MLLQKVVDGQIVQPAQRQIMHTAPLSNVRILTQCRAGHSIYWGFVQFHGIAIRVFRLHQKSVLLLAAGDITAVGALAATLKSRTRNAAFILAHKNAVAVVAARGLVQDAAANAVAQHLGADAAVHQVGSNGFGVSIRGRKCKWTRLVRLYRRCLSRLKRNSDRRHLVQQTNR